MMGILNTEAFCNKAKTFVSRPAAIIRFLIEVYDEMKVYVMWGPMR